jgi:hypothetical protein
LSFAKRKNMQNRKELHDQMKIMIADWQSSGLKQHDYCVVNNIAKHVFRYWLRVLKVNKTDAGSFLPVKVVSAVSKEQITIIGVSGIKIQIPLTEKSIGFVKQLLLA